MKATLTVTQNEKSPKFNVITIKFDNGYTSTWEWCPITAEQSKIDYFVKNATYMAERENHKHCSENPCDECLSKIHELLASPKFLYARERDYGTTIYHKDENSPTGVCGVGGMPNHLSDQLLHQHGHTSSLSPTEDLRTSH